MTTLFDNVVTSNDVWRGASRFLYAASGTSFPGKLESVIQPSSPNDPDASAYALGSGWTDFGGTTKDGVTINREFEGADGVTVDQLKYQLFAGEPVSWKMMVSATLSQTSQTNLRIAWELPATRSIAADASGPDYKVAQTYLKFSAPDSLTERLLAVVQQHSENSNLRVAAFRKAVLTPESREMIIQSSEASNIPIQFECKADSSVDNDEDPFGGEFVETYS